MLKPTIIALTSVAAIGGTLASQAEAANLVSNATSGYYNNQLGDLYNVNPAIFPGPNVSTGDPTATFSDAPDLSGVTALGDWLTDPAGTLASSTDWSGLQPIPANWNINDETAIIYEIDGGLGGFTDIEASFGVDNQIFVWLNGVYQFGATAPGGASPGEYTFALDDLTAGTNYLQVLRADHGGRTGYNVSISGNAKAVPEPASLLGLFLMGSVAIGGALKKTATA